MYYCDNYAGNGRTTAWTELWDWYDTSSTCGTFRQNSRPKTIFFQEITVKLMDGINYILWEHNQLYNTVLWPSECFLFTYTLQIINETPACLLSLSSASRFMFWPLTNLYLNRRKGRTHHTEDMFTLWSSTRRHSCILTNISIYRTHRYTDTFGLQFGDFSSGIVLSHLIIYSGILLSLGA